MSSQRRAFGIQKKMMRKDSGSAYERCRQVADYARSQGYLGLKVCSAVHKNEINLVIFPEDKPGQIDIQTGEDDERQRITPELVKELTGVNI
jgi:RES domain-containing protein